MLPLMLRLVDNKVVVLLFMYVVLFSLNKLGELYQCQLPGCDIMLELCKLLQQEMGEKFMDSLCIISYNECGLTGVGFFLIKSFKNREGEGGEDRRALIT